MKKYGLLLMALLLVGLFAEPSYAGMQDLQGDINSDGIVSADDALSVLKHIAHIEELDEEELEKVDVNCDDLKDSVDALYILKYAANIIDSFEDIVAVIKPQATEVPKQPTGFEKIDELQIDYNYYNCFEIVIFSETEKVFTKEDFAEDAITDVWTKSKTKTKNGYEYRLVIEFEKDPWDTYEKMQRNLMRDFENLDNVSEVSYNELVERDTKISFSCSEYEMEVGQTLYLYISDYNPYFESWDAVIKVKLNEGYYLSEEELSHYGVISISKDYAAEDNYEYTIGVKKELRNDRDLVALTHVLSQNSAIDEVSVSVLPYPIEKNGIEEWTCSDESSVSMNIIGGSDNEAGNGKIDQTGVITGLTPGKAVITVKRNDGVSKEGVATCVITVTEPAKGIKEVNHEYAFVIRTDGRMHDSSSELRSRIISTYDEYKAYVDEVESRMDSRRWENIDIYAEEFFDNNSLYVADFWETSGSISNEFMSVTSEDGKTYINIEKNSPSIQTCDMAHWDVLVPIEGKDWKDEDISIRFNEVSELISGYTNFGGIYPSEDLNSYLTVITTYEEYQEFMAKVKANNPDYKPSHDYQEYEFQYYNIVVGGFWTFSGQLELDYTGMTVKDGKVSINFDGRCPNPCTEDSYFYSFMISYEKSSYTEEDMECVIDTEYYDTY